MRWVRTADPLTPSTARRGNAAAVFDALGAAGFSESVVEIAREGFRKTSEVLAPFVTLLHPEWLAQPGCESARNRGSDANPMMKPCD